MAWIGIISDTHGLLRPEAVERLRGVTRIVHVGDIGAPEIVPRLQDIAPVTAIRGNIDTAEWAMAYPETAAVTIADRRLFVIHDRKDVAFDAEADGFDIVLSGHSHRPGFEFVGRVLFLNPGSAGPRRFRLPVTLATLDLGRTPLEPEIHVLI